MGPWEIRNKRLVKRESILERGSPHSDESFVASCKGQFVATHITPDRSFVFPIFADSQTRTPPSPQGRTHARSPAASSLLALSIRTNPNQRGAPHTTAHHGEDSHYFATRSLRGLDGNHDGRQVRRECARGPRDLGTDAVDRYIGLMLAVSSSLAIGTSAMAR